MNKKQKTEKLGRLIEQKTPDWLDNEQYEEYTKKRSTLRANSNIENNIESIFGEDILEGKSPNPNWKSYSFQASPEPLVTQYNNDLLFSEPGSGQDPKMYSAANLKTAAHHSGRHWGSNENKDENGKLKPSNSQWIESGTFNIVEYPNGKVVLEPCNVEHRLWGLIGFPLGIVPVDSKHDLWFYDDGLPELYDEDSKQMHRRIKVNKMYLSDIVKECDACGVNVTEADVLNSHFYSNDFNFTILPFYSKEECEHYFREVNTSSSKTRLQLHHSESGEIMYFWKNNSSPKCVNFKPMKCNYHPLIELLPDTDKVKLEGLAYMMLISDYISQGEKPIDSTDSKLIERYHHTNGYKSFFNEEFKEKVFELSDYVYDLISSSVVPIKLSRQMIQQLLIMKKYLEFNGYIIQDTTSFIVPYRKHYLNAQEDAGGNMTPFGRDVRSGSKKNAKTAFLTTKKDFLKSMTDIEYLKSIGIVPVAESLKRVFDENTILDSLEAHKGLDIDGEVLTTKPVGGHIISDMELIRMTDEERDEAFKKEGLGDKFDFDKNCRAMSAYHNNRMGVLRLSSYLNIIDEPDENVRAAVNFYYNHLVEKKLTLAA